MKHTQFRIRNGFDSRARKIHNIETQNYHYQSQINTNILKHDQSNHELVDLMKDFFGTVKQMFAGVSHKRLDLQSRDRIYHLKPPFGRVYSERKQSIKKWAQKMVSDTVSIAFNYYSKDELSYQQTKIFSSESILSNIAALISQYKLTPPQLQQIDQFLRDQVLDLLLKKYPLTESIVVNRALQVIAVAPNLSQKLENDFFSFNQIHFEYQNDYSKEIKNTINAIIESANSKFNQNITSNFEAFKMLMTRIFEIVQDKKWMQFSNEEKRFQLFEKCIYQNQKEIRQSIENDPQKRDYRDKVKYYTSYLIGRKVSQNVAPFTNEQINAKGVDVKNTAILRILTKWCQELWQKFIPKNYYANKSQSFRLLSGQIKSISPQMRARLDKLMQIQKVQIKKFMQKMTNDNYQTQLNLLNQLLQNYDLEYQQSEYQKISQKFSVMIGKSLQKWIVKYLNRLLEGLTKVAKQFHNQYYQNEWPSPPNLVTFRIGDLLRCKCSSGQRQIINILKLIKSIEKNMPETLKITRIKNRLSSGTNDILMNINFYGKAICEIQLAVKSNKSKFLASSTGMSHYLYEVQRSLFGPINEIGSIWRNLDLRASFYDKKSTNSKSGKVHGCEISKKVFEFQLFEGSFICSKCSNTYSQNKTLIRHVKCSQCSFWKCASCIIDEMSIKDLVKTYISDENIQNICEKRVVYNEDSKRIPNYGVAIKIQELSPRAILFKMIEVRGISYLFSKNQEDGIKLLLNLGQQAKQRIFLKQYLVFEVSDENGNGVLSMSEGDVIQEYMLPKYMQKLFKNKQKQIILQNQPLSQLNYDKVFKTTEEDRLNIQTLSFHNTNIANISPLQYIFPNTKVLILSQNKQLSNLQSLPLFPNLHSLIIKKSDKFETIPQSICNMPQLTKLQLKDSSFSVIPPVISNLQNLKYLNISHSEDAKRSWRIKFLPDELYTLRELQQLHISKQLVEKLSEKISELRNLKILNISYNLIEELPPTINELQYLQQFNFKYNPIKILPKSLGCLRNVRQFRLQSIGEDIQNIFNISMHRNNFDQLPQDLEEIKNLIAIDIHSQNLKKLPSLKKCKKLQRIDLFRCSLVAPILLSNCLSLKYLNLRQQMHIEAKERLYELPPQLFKQTPNLEYLCASYNYIRQVPASIGNLTHLLELDLCYNQIGVISEQIGKCIALSNINLWKNEVKKIPSSISNLKNLRKLSLSQNCLQSIDQSLTKCIELRQLILFNNSIELVDEHIGDLKNLEVLDLYNNLISVLPSSMNNMNKLKQGELKIEKNPIFYIECRDCISKYGNYSSKRIQQQLSASEFSHISMGRNKLKKMNEQISKAKQLKIFNLQQHQLKQLPSQFSALYLVQKVNLRSNLFQQFPLPITGCASLIQLDLQSNQIKAIPQQIGRLVNLQALNLSINKLERIDERINNCSSLITVYLMNNLLQNISVNTFSGLKNLKYIFLNENRLQIFPKGLVSCQNLQHICLDSNMINKLDCSLANLIKLKKIGLNFNKFTEFPQQIIECPSIQCINMSYNCLTKLSDNIYKMSKIDELDFNTNQIREIPRSIGKAKSLTALNMPCNLIELVPNQLSQLNCILNLFKNPIKKVECRSWVLKKGNKQTQKIVLALPQ